MASTKDKQNAMNTTTINPANEKIATREERLQTLAALNTIAEAGKKLAIAAEALGLAVDDENMIAMIIAYAKKQ